MRKCPKMQRFVRLKNAEINEKSAIYMVEMYMAERVDVI